MKDESERELQRYLKSAENWASDRNDLIARSKTTAWRVTAIVSAIALLEALALFALVPLKTVQPYTLLVDRHTGYVEALKPFDRTRLSADTALTRSFLVQYVIAREGFAVETVQADYRKVTLWSGDEARQQYMASMQPSNPQSPLALYPRSTMIDVVIKSVTSLAPDTAMIRFDTQRVDRAGPGENNAWVAVLRFTYTGEPLSAADRLINPIGFRVVRYRRSQEELAETPLPPPPPPPFPAGLENRTVAARATANIATVLAPAGGQHSGAPR